MLDLGPDIENLFRRAAEHYPLKPGEDQWDLIRSRLAARTKPVTGRNKRTWRRWFTLLSVMLITLPLNYYRSILEVKGPAEIPSQGKSENRQATIEKNNPSFLPVGFPAVSPGHTASVNNSGRFFASDEGLTFTAVHSAPEENILSGFSYAPKLNQRRFTGQHLLSNTIVSAPRKELSVPFLTVSPKAKPGIKARLKNEWHYGISGGSSLSSVKTSGLNKPGFEAGIIVGYHFKNKLSLESGLLFGVKYYPSRGEFFNPKSMPAGTDVMELQGCNYSFQVPLVLQYDLDNSKRKRIFVSAGLASYLLLKEQNDYDLMVNGTQQQMLAKYHENKNYLAAAVHLGVGYEMKISKSFHIRVEPFVQLPLRGIGVGELPVTTGGIHFGISRYSK
jgi:hypothetical protein